MSTLLDAVRLLHRPEWTRGVRPDGVRPGKVRAAGAEPVTVFVVGLRINRWLRVRRWLPLVLTLPPMLRELTEDPDGGLLGYRLLFGPGPRQAMVLQYWRSPDDLHRFAREAEGGHRSAQRRYWWHYGSTDAVGVWHELLAGAHGAQHGVYGNMPPTGLGALHPAHSRRWWAELDAERRAADRPPVAP